MKQIAEGDNMKIGIISEKKIGLLITTTIFILCSILPILFPIDFETKTVIIVMIIVTYLIVLLCYLMTMEWYILDENSIIVKNIFGTINQVYYKNVSLVYIKKMPFFTKDIKGIPCLLFKDIREERGVFGGYNVNNCKKYIVRIPYTQDVVDFFKSNNIYLNKNTIFDTLVND